MASSRDAWDITADDDDELEDTYYETAKETILFCIDASESMQQRFPSAKKKRDQRSSLHAALECAAELQKRLVLFNPSTSVGILLYNTDLTDFGATVVPFFINNKAEPFDITKFYSHVFTDLYEGGSMEPIPDPITGFDELKEEMRIRESVKRALFSVPLQLGDGLSIGVKGYSLVMEMRRGAAKKFINMGQRVEDVIPVTAFVDSEQQIEVEKDQIMFGMKSSAVAEEEEAEPAKARRRQPALFTAEQIKEFKTLGVEPGIKILGFKDRDTLRFQDQLKHAYFIYPDESVYSGSTRTFNALLKATINRNKVALVRFLPRRASTPVFAALLPQAEKVTEQGQQVPPGFHVITLPFADDIRAPDLGELKGAAEEQTDLACKIIEKLTLKGQGYVPDTYLNPALGLHYGQLQATAFNEAFDPDDYVDTTVPNYEMIHKRAGEPMREWKEMLEEDPEANIIVAPVKKSAATGTKRKADDSGSLDEMHVRDYYNDGRMNKLTVAQLKAFLKSKALPVSGNKAELLERAENWLASHG
ncbi:ATP-dependent DNA helicase II subunit 1 [Tulasnella sp. UAMH 9824]|nr:ATP-dependent DNA helicase II subunit 1 [Tulasnella sp. UAMH 9824]